MFEMYLTDIGKAKDAWAMIPGNVVDLTEIAIGTGGGSSFYDRTPEQMEAMTELVDQRYRADITSLQIDPVNSARLIAVLTVGNDIGGFDIREVGIFDSEGDLFAIGKFPETYKPLPVEGTGVELNIEAIIEVQGLEENYTLIFHEPLYIQAVKNMIDYTIGSWYDLFIFDLIDTGGQCSGLINTSTNSFDATEEYGFAKFAAKIDDTTLWTPNTDGIVDILASTNIDLKITALLPWEPYKFRMQFSRLTSFEEDIQFDLELIDKLRTNIIITGT